MKRKHGLEGRRSGLSPPVLWENQAGVSGMRPGCGNEANFSLNRSCYFCPVTSRTNSRPARFSFFFRR